MGVGYVFFMSVETLTVIVICSIDEHLVQNGREMQILRDAEAEKELKRDLGLMVVNGDVRRDSETGHKISA